MKKTYHFGKIKAYQNGKKINAVDVSIELSGTQGEEEFTASGTVWNATKTDCIMGGQCLDELFQHDELKVNPTFKEIYRLWKAYHLNGMHPECEHQKALGWEEKAEEQVNIYTFTMDADTIRAQKILESKVLQAAKYGEEYLTTQDEQLLLGLNYSVKTHCDTLPENISKFYKRKDTEQKTLGWLHEKDHPDGILGKPCPVCGYKYGTAWKHHPIPADDLAIIKKLIEEE